MVGWEHLVALKTTTKGTGTFVVVLLTRPTCPNGLSQSVTVRDQICRLVLQIKTLG